jgi:hypothetical protein
MPVTSKLMPSLITFLKPEVPARVFKRHLKFCQCNLDIYAYQ